MVSATTSLKPITSPAVPFTSAACGAEARRPWAISVLEPIAPVSAANRARMRGASSTATPPIITPSVSSCERLTPSITAVGRASKGVWIANSASRAVSPAAAPADRVIGSGVAMISGPAYMGTCETGAELTGLEPHLPRLDAGFAVRDVDVVQVLANRVQAGNTLEAGVHDQQRGRRPSSAVTVAAFDERPGDVAGERPRHALVVRHVHEQLAVVLQGKIEQHQLLAQVRAPARDAIPSRWRPEGQVVVKTLVVEEQARSHDQAADAAVGFGHDGSAQPPPIDGWCAGRPM